MTELPHILNWRRINDWITTSGQPSPEQLAEIRDVGCSCIVNLAPSDNESALTNEAELVSELGLDYVYIPVDFEAPTQEDYDHFCAALARFDGQSLHVHCIYNARVSAFFTRYAQEGRGGSVDAARQQMDGIWRPGGVWAAFLGLADQTSQPNRYKGYDYN